MVIFSFLNNMRIKFILEFFKILVSNETFSYLWNLENGGKKKDWYDLWSDNSKFYIYNSIIVICKLLNYEICVYL